jgi:hypothetical protein
VSTTEQQLQATFTQARTTPGTFVYKEQVDDGETEISGSFYIKKAAAKLLGDPKKVEITIRAAS